MKQGPEVPVRLSTGGDVCTEEKTGEGEPSQGVRMAKNKNRTQAGLLGCYVLFWGAVERE